VWTKCPKTNFVGLERVLSATCSSVTEFNSGVESSTRYLFDVMQVPSDAHLLSSDNINNLSSNNNISQLQYTVTFYVVPVVDMLYVFV